MGMKATRPLNVVDIVLGMGVGLDGQTRAASSEAQTKITIEEETWYLCFWREKKGMDTGHIRN
jgi:hypothetical protein